MWTGDKEENNHFPRNKTKTSENNNICAKDIHTTINEDDHDDHTSARIGYPSHTDGGYGWVIVFGASLSAFTAFSVMQDYLVEHMFDSSKQAQFLVSFVGSICYFVSEIATPLVQITLERLGVRITLLIGTTMISAGLLASGFATTIWHLYLSQGVCYGLGISLIYLAIMMVIPQWFSKRCSTATAISMSSIGLAGLVIPFVMNISNSKLGGSWTFWIMGFTYLGANILACILVKEKNYQGQPTILNNKISAKLSKSVVKDLLKDSNYMIFIGAAFLQVLSRNVPFFFLPSYATFVGLDTSQGTSLICLACAASFVGRIVVGMLADRLGNLFVGAIFGTITGLASLSLWTSAYSYPMLVALAIVIGFSFDTYYILMPPTVLQLLGRQKYTSGLSVLMVLTSPAILGPSLISAIDNALNCEQFLPHKIFSGVLPILSSLLLLFLRFRIKKQHQQ
ncbi:major facilitator superfamily domain-containing protein [Phascolomyces articulosus]|uniref:Major facilitator superfamily domain-containing protein n=1 Tax=Phascolomyces articulosus TaxID=60185 RepID=A0AAD5KP16_9FUNG|nr:major facilitator superfamily domain-containing protein [Phascolomyces articulosus]